MTTSSGYPTTLDVFLPLIDGLHPVAGDDFNVLMDAMERIQKTCGFGQQASASGVYGPKGGAASVAERLNVLFAADGSGIDDFVFITGTMPAYRFSEGTTANPGAGVLIPYGRTMSGVDCVILFRSAMPGEQADGTDSSNVLGAVVLATLQTADGVRLCARLANGAAIALDNDTMIAWGLLAFGPKAHYL